MLRTTSVDDIQGTSSSSTKAVACVGMNVRIAESRSATRQLPSLGIQEAKTLTSLLIRITSIMFAEQILVRRLRNQPGKKKKLAFEKNPKVVNFAHSIKRANFFVKFVKKGFLTIFIFSKIRQIIQLHIGKFIVFLLTSFILVNLPLGNPIPNWSLCTQNQPY